MHTVEQRQGIDHLPLAQWKSPAGTFKLGNEKGQVKASDTEAGQVRVVEEAGYAPHAVDKSGTAGDVFIADAVDG